VKAEFCGLGIMARPGTRRDSAAILQVIEGMNGRTG
jgi:hypothetical protein